MERFSLLGNIKAPRKARLSKEEDIWTTIYIAAVTPAGIGANILGRRWYDQYVIAGRNVDDLVFWVAFEGPASFYDKASNLAKDIPFDTLKIKQNGKIYDLTPGMYKPLPFHHAKKGAPDMEAQGLFYFSKQISPNPTKNLELQYIVKGDIIQAVVSQRLSRTTSAHPFQIYRSLRAINPSPYMYYLDLDGFQIVGASPEMLVQVEGSAVATHPIAGTRPRGSDLAEDNVNERELRIDEKEQAEHIMLFDLGRNDIGRVSEPGTVEVTEMMEVERYSHVMHLVSNVKGRLMDHLTNYDALRACFPAGTVSGAPKIRAMEIISELEPDKRGPYAGSVGYFDLGGNMDTAITIRTLVMKDGVAYAQAGGGIVYDSVPEAEYQETLHKASALLRAIDEAESEG